LLDRWVEAYLRTLRPQTLLHRYQADQPDGGRRSTCASTRRCSAENPRARCSRAI
jgi:hypothetical protein